MSHDVCLTIFCPYSDVPSATLWRKTFDKFVAEMRDKQ